MYIIIVLKIYIVMTIVKLSLIMQVSIYIVCIILMVRSHNKLKKSTTFNEININIYNEL